MSDMNIKVLKANSVSYDLDPIVNNVPNSYKVKTPVDCEDQVVIPAFCSGSVNNYKVITSGYVYKLTRPCFIYSQHYNGAWNSKYGFKVFVSDNANMEDPYLLIDTNGGDSSHSNNLMLISGNSTVYVCIIASNPSDGSMTRTLLIVPTYGVTDAVSVASSTAISPSSTSSDPNRFKEIFKVPVKFPVIPDM